MKYSIESIELFVNVPNDGQKSEKVQEFLEDQLKEAFPQYELDEVDYDDEDIENFRYRACFLRKED